MGNQYLVSPLGFLLDTLFSLYILVVMLRFLLQLVRADFYNPISQFLVAVTNPPLRLLRRVIPGWQGVDVAAIVLMVALQLLNGLILVALHGKSVALATLVFWSVTQLLGLVFDVFIFAIIIQVLISWINPGLHNPFNTLLYSLTEPLLRPARRLIPPISGIDLSPLAVLILLQMLRILVIPLIERLTIA